MRMFLQSSTAWSQLSTNASRHCKDEEIGDSIPSSEIQAITTSEPPRRIGAGITVKLNEVFRYSIRQMLERRRCENLGLNVRKQEPIKPAERRGVVY